MFGVVYKAGQIRLHRRHCDATMERPIQVELSDTGDFFTGQEEVNPRGKEMYLVECRAKVGIEIPAQPAAGPHVVSFLEARTRLMQHECITRIYIEDDVWVQFSEKEKEEVLEKYTAVYITPK